MTVDEKIAGFEVLGGFITERSGLIRRIEGLHEDFRCTVKGEDLCKKFPETAEAIKSLWLKKLKIQLVLIEEIILKSTFEELTAKAQRKRTNGS